jgi:hypothetical protein
MKRVLTNSIVAFISMIAATSGGGDLARASPMLAFGAGTLSCGVWLQHAQTADAYHVVMASWIDGYLTSANENRSEAGQTALDQNTEGTGFDAWISRYCKANPQAPLFRAAMALFLDLAKPVARVVALPSVRWTSIKDTPGGRPGPSKSP